MISNSNISNLILRLKYLFYSRLCTINEGRVAIGDLKSGFMPCTPYGCIELIKRCVIKIMILFIQSVVENCNTVIK